MLHRGPESIRPEPPTPVGGTPPAHQELSLFLSGICPRDYFLSFVLLLSFLIRAWGYGLFINTVPETQAGGPEVTSTPMYKADCVCTQGQSALCTSLASQHRQLEETHTPTQEPSLLKLIWGQATPKPVHNF